MLTDTAALLVFGTYNRHRLAGFDPLFTWRQHRDRVARSPAEPPATLAADRANLAKWSKAYAATICMEF